MNKIMRCVVIFLVVVGVLGFCIHKWNVLEEINLLTVENAEIEDSGNTNTNQNKEIRNQINQLYEEENLYDKYKLEDAVLYGVIIILLLIQIKLLANKVKELEHHLETYKKRHDSLLQDYDERGEKITELCDELDKRK